MATLVDIMTQLLGRTPESADYRNEELMDQVSRVMREEQEVRFKDPEARKQFGLTQEILKEQQAADVKIGGESQGESKG